jgi:hypothetical protein
VSDIEKSLDKMINITNEILIDQLTQQLAERDALILELSKIKDKYACPDMYDFTTSHHGIVKYQKICWEDMGRIENGAICGGKLARTPLKNQKLLDKIKGSL